MDNLMTKIITKVIKKKEFDGNQSKIGFSKQK